jgi:N-acetylmuramoyl-L-alanine amidase
MLLPKGTFIPRSLTGSFRVWGDDRYDYVSIPLQEKLPYRSIQEIDPARIAVDIFGATVNTNWITQLRNVKEIKNVYYRQLSDGMLRVIIELKHSQHWGYHIYYDGNSLMVRVKRQPEKLELQHLTIAIDAGHGGRNFGAHGPTGAYEKDLTLQIAQKLQDMLQKAGATVLMTRTTDETRDMIQRTLFLREADPDLLVSIHLNASSDPVHVNGTSTYYRYIGFRPLSEAILQHMLELGLDEFGNVGRFNFALNGPTEFPNALVETVFLSNPADEMKALDPVFRQQMAKAVMQGIRDFLQNIKKEAGSASDPD